jgi:hypothetical protein
LITEPGILIPAKIARELPSMVRNELGKLPAYKQEEFTEEYRRKAKSKTPAYLLWLFLGFHYAYQGKWGIQILFWLTGGGLGVWWLVDLFRIGGMVGQFNKDVAVEVLRNMKAVSA